VRQEKTAAYADGTGLNEGECSASRHFVSGPGRIGNLYDLFVQIETRLSKGILMQTFQALKKSKRSFLTVFPGSKP
jgi:hypothetical protein